MENRSTSTLLTTFNIDFLVGNVLYQRGRRTHSLCPDKRHQYSSNHLFQGTSFIISLCFALPSKWLVTAFRSRAIWGHLEQEENVEWSKQKKNFLQLASHGLQMGCARDYGTSRLLPSGVWKTLFGRPLLSFPTIIVFSSFGINMWNINSHEMHVGENIRK